MRDKLRPAELAGSPLRTSVANHSTRGSFATYLGRQARIASDVHTREIMLHRARRMRVYAGDALGEGPGLVLQAERGRFSIGVAERRGAWSRVVAGHRTDGAVVDGWVRSNALVPLPESEGTIGLGNLGTIGHGGGGGPPPGTEVVVAPGSPVFARPGQQTPWAEIRGTESVRAELHGEWAHIVEVPNLDVGRGEMWVRQSALRLQTLSRMGVVMRRRIVDGRAVIDVESVAEWSPVFEGLGLRSGDRITGLVTEDIPPEEVAAWWIRAPIDELVSYFDQLPIRVERGEEQLVLFHTCAQQHWRETRHRHECCMP